MNPFLLGFLIIAGTLVLFEVIYWLVHNKAGFINLGRIAAGTGLLIGDILSQIQGLPWSDIVSEGQAKLIAFGITVALILKQAYDKAKAAASA
jgi:hypothetical protein